MKGIFQTRAEGRTAFARSLRRKMTDAERRLWGILRNRRLAGLKFRRQVPLGPYVLDFFCVEKMIAIELDGGQHYTEPGRTRDAARDQYLRDRGVEVLRYSDRDVLVDCRSVTEDIYKRLNYPSP